MELYLGTIVIWPVQWVPAGYNACDGTLLNVQQNAALYSLLGVAFGGNAQTTFGVPDLRGRVPVGVGLFKTGTSFALGQIGGVESVQVAVQIPGNTPLGIGTGTVSGNLTITAAQLPSHTHGIAGASVPVSIPANTGGGTTDTPGNTTILAKGTVVGGPVNTTAKAYSTTASNANLLPFNVDIPAATTQATGNGSAIPLSLNVSTNVVAPASGISIGGVLVPVMQPFMALNYIICISGYYPQRP